MTRIGVFLVAGLVAACSDRGGDEYGALYEAPDGPVSPDLYGLWGGSIDPGPMAPALDARWGLWPDEVVLAVRCGDKIVGVAVAADVDETQIRTLESADAGDEDCGIGLVPRVLEACAPYERRDDCFERDGLALSVYYDNIPAAEFTKLSDTF